MSKALAQRCNARAKSTGIQCKRNAIPGGTVCSKHGGGAPQVKAKAAVRAELLSWGLRDETVDPGEVLLKLVTQSAARCARYAAELEELVDADGLAAAMVGDTVVATRTGVEKSGEYIRGLAQLEAQERDRTANFATKAIAAGLAERQVRLAERQGQLMVDMVHAALKEVNLTGEQETAFKVALARQVRAIGAA